LKIRLTHPTAEYQAGVIVELPEKEAQELISKDWAFEVEVEQVEVTTFSDPLPVYIDGTVKRKGKVK
jgi:hypothetical protein